MLRTAILTLFMSAVAGASLAQDAVDAAAVKPVKLTTVSSETRGMSRQFFGQVVARQTVDMSFQVGGQIVEFPAIEGQVTPKGGVIARLDLTDFELAVEQARLQQQQAERQVDRYEKLKGSAVSEVALEDAITDAALARVAARKAEVDLEHATIHAPYDALVAERFVENFTTISAGTTVIRLHDMSELRIEIAVPEVMFQQVGSDADVTVTARFPGSDTTYPLELREFNAETSVVGQTFQLTFGMTPPEGMVVLPGSSVTVMATLNDGGASLTLPATALVANPEGDLSAFVFEADSDGSDIGVVRRVDLEVEPLPSGEMKVIEGLEDGAQVVAMGADLLEDGQRVRRFRTFGQ